MNKLVHNLECSFLDDSESGYLECKIPYHKDYQILYRILKWFGPLLVYCLIFFSAAEKKTCFNKQFPALVVPQWD